MKRILLFLTFVIAVGCDRDASSDVSPAPSSDVTRPTAPATKTSGLPRVVFLGDSITAGYGLDAEQAFPAIVRDQLAKDGIQVDIVNAGRSGDTTAGGLARIDWILQQKPDIVVVGLGGNDGLRAQDVKSSESNLRAIVTRARAAGAQVLLLGMLIPPNYGPEYTKEFREIYPRIADEMNVPLVPFLLEGVGGEARLNQGDGIHPTAEGHQLVAQNVLPHLREMLKNRPAPTTAPAAQ
jgi:acyl-CoA thioesterase-1